MMNLYQQFKKNVEQRQALLEDRIRELEEQRLADPVQTAHWREALSRVKVSLEDQLLRIAVVGSVKSGKSTLINTLLERDLLKRGAGITTAFITRIKTSRDLGGWVELKPWKQVLEEINESLKLLPLPQGESHEMLDVDLRRPEDRDRLRDRVRRIQRDWQQARGPLDSHFILLNNMLQGYSAVENMIGDEVNRLLFEGHSIGQHQRFAGVESNAAYVRDMELHVPAPWLGESIEIADCQGSDSPNPLHLGHVQQYLMCSHFILYVINSRMGLRESDFKLLELVKTLRMAPQTFFVLNVDLDDHPDVADIRRILERVREELSWVVPHPRVYAFSGLYHLMDAQGESLAEAERSRFDLWRRCSSMSSLTREGFSAFRRDLIQRVCEQRTRVLCAVGLSRLCMVAGSLMDTAAVRRELLDRDVQHLQQSVADLRRRQKDLQATLETLKNAISGLRVSVTRDLGKAADEYFDLKDGPLVREITELVKHYPVEGRYERDLADPRGVVRTLHTFYANFRHDVSHHLIERTNARIIEFAREQEEFIGARLRDASRAFWSLYARALDEYRSEAARYGISLSSPVGLGESEWKAPPDLTPPTFGVIPEQQAVSRSILLMKFGLGRLSRFLTDLKGRMGAPADSGCREARGRERFEEAVALVKSETSAELLQSFRMYRDSFKREYLQGLVEQGARNLLEAFQSRAGMVQVDFGNLLDQSQLEGEDRLARIACLSRTREVAQRLLEELEELSCAVQLEWLPDEALASPGGPEPSAPTAAR